MLRHLLIDSRDIAIKPEYVLFLMPTESGFGVQYTSDLEVEVVVEHIGTRSQKV